MLDTLLEWGINKLLNLASESIWKTVILTLIEFNFLKIFTNLIISYLFCTTNMNERFFE